MQANSSFSSPDSLSTYLSEISQYALLTQPEEQALARRFRAGDLAAGHQLVTSNLRFVVKVAYEYRSYGFKMSDLIQEANIGLMKAVQKFDPDKGIRLISYAVWWIRAYLQNYILKSWSLVKLGTTQAQRRLFFALARTRRELEKLGANDGTIVNAEEIARKLNVKASEVREMEQRMGGRDLSLDAPMGEDGDATHMDFVESEAASHADEVADRQEAQMNRERIQRALARLDPRERFIIEQRVMSDAGMTLSELGEHFGFSRERARQLEIRAKDKLKAELAALMPEGQEQIAG
ncbi:RNA polymerase factor sigma-32 [Archangium sp.]|uniref:RNA polymerase factor sigma-32 n=1 Tax=Archangium sp. TaxID=1872627 RepID=UPI00286A86C7|nr:RNA polymerase factor sigma-32 [Archangium sp.]